MWISFKNFRINLSQVTSIRVTKNSRSHSIAFYGRYTGYATEDMKQPLIDVWKFKTNEEVNVVLLMLDNVLQSISITQPDNILEELKRWQEDGPHNEGQLYLRFKAKTEDGSIENIEYSYTEFHRKVKEGEQLFVSYEGYKVINRLNPEVFYKVDNSSS